MDTYLKNCKMHMFNVDAEAFLNNLSPKVLKRVVEYFENKGEHVIYFPFVKTFRYSLEEVEAYSLMYKLEKDIDLITHINKRYNFWINEWDLEKIQKGKIITDGYLRAIDYLITAYTAPKNSIIIIDKYEQGLHPNITGIVMKDIYRIAQPKYQILTTYKAPEYLDESVRDIRDLEKQLDLEISI